MSDIEPAVLVLTNARLVAVHSALVELARRKLPTISSDFKVARRIEALKPALAAYEAARKKKIEEHTEGDELVRPTELRAALDELGTIEVEVPAPKAKLSESDLPKPMKGDDGEKNAAGVGAIVADLGPDFFDIPDE